MIINSILDSYLPGISQDRITNSKDYQKQIERLTCSICLHVLWKPVCCSICQIAYCDACITKWINNNNNLKCPNKCLFIKSKASPYLNQILSDLTIKCRYSNLGCKEIFYYDEIEKHEKSCSGICKFCQQSEAIDKLVMHQEDCKLAKVCCNACKKTFSRLEIKDHSELDCLRKLYDDLKKDIVHREYEFNQLKIEKENLAGEKNSLLSLCKNYEFILSKNSFLPNKDYNGPDSSRKQHSYSSKEILHTENEFNPSQINKQKVIVERNFIQHNLKNYVYKNNPLMKFDIKIKELEKNINEGNKPISQAIIPLIRTPSSASKRNIVKLNITLIENDNKTMNNNKEDEIKKDISPLNNAMMNENQQIQLICDNNHKLIFKSFKVYDCVNCKKHQFGVCWYCDDCPYNLCMTCKMTVFLKDICLNGHTLSLVNDKYTTCNKCDKLSLGIFNVCSACNFDLCISCVKEIH